MKTRVEGSYFRTDTYFYTPSSGNSKKRVSVSIIQPVEKGIIYKSLMSRQMEEALSTQRKWLDSVRTKHTSPTVEAFLNRSIEGKNLSWKDMPNLLKDVFRKNLYTQEITFIYGDFSSSIYRGATPLTIKVPKNGVVVFVDFFSTQKVSTQGKGITLVDESSGMTTLPVFSTPVAVKINSGNSVLPELKNVDPVISTSERGKAGDKVAIEVKSFGYFFDEKLPWGTNLCTYIKSNNDYQTFRVGEDQFVVNSVYKGYDSVEGDVKADGCTVNHHYRCGTVQLVKDGLLCDQTLIGFNGIAKHRDASTNICSVLVTNFDNITSRISETGTFTYGKCSFEFGVEKVSVSFYRTGCFIKADSKSVSVPENIKKDISQVSEVEWHSKVFGKYNYANNGCSKLFVSSKGLVCVSASKGQIYNLPWKEKCL